MGSQTALLVLTAATWAHLGFQVTVSTLVYPVLAATPSTAWAEAHGRHSRVIAPTVAVLYAALLVGSVAVLVTGPADAVLVALAGVALSLGTTAVLAAPLHGRLGTEGPSPQRLARLLVVDRVRTLGAAVAAAGATAAWF